jgi:hypothetical protein
VETQREVRKLPSDTVGYPFLRSTLVCQLPQDQLGVQPLGSKARVESDRTGVVGTVKEVETR